MPIPFPKMHIAQSVLNRIANQLEEKGPLGMASNEPAPIEIQEPPITPNPLTTGMTIEDSLSNPPAPSAVPPENETDANSEMLKASVMGGSPFDGALVGSGL